jgi:hypothetical protein
LSKSEAGTVPGRLMGVPLKGVCPPCGLMELDEEGALAAATRLGIGTAERRSA